MKPLAFRERSLVAHATLEHCLASEVTNVDADVPSYYDPTRKLKHTRMHV